MAFGEPTPTNPLDALAGVLSAGRRAFGAAPTFPWPGLTRPVEYDDVHRRAVCLTLAMKSLGDKADVSVYDAIAAADYLDRGYLDSEPPEEDEAADEDDDAVNAAADEPYRPTDLRGQS